MMQSALLDVGVIMDGNGRWATERGLPRVSGHREGAEAVRRIVAAAPQLGIRSLTLFAFSSDNWLRPADEVSFLMKLFLRAVRREEKKCRQESVRLNFIGRRDRLHPRLLRAMEEAEVSTVGGERLLLRIAIDYSARAAIEQAASLAGGELAERLHVAMNASERVDRIDLVIRTGREKRLSDFLLFEAAYAELYFTDTMWPEFSPDQLGAIVEDFRRRERRFGRTPAQVQRSEASHV